MTEIKGQLLGIMLLLLVFGVIATGLISIYRTSADDIVQINRNVEEYVSDATVIGD